MTTALVVETRAGDRALRACVVAAGVPAANVYYSESALGALTELALRRPDVIVLGLGAAPGDGLDLLNELLVLAPGCPVVVVVEGDVAADAAASGASACLDWPAVERGELAAAIELACSSGARARTTEMLSAHMHAVWSALDEGVLVLGASGRVLGANPAAAAILGCPSEQLLFCDFFGDRFEWSDADGRLLGPKDVPGAVSLRTGRPVPATLQRIERPDGSRRCVECAATPLIRGEGRPPYAVVASFRDVTSEREAYEALLAAERRQHLLTEHAAEGHLVLDAQGRITEASASIARYWDLQSVIGTDARNLLHPDDRPAVRRLLWRVVARKSTSARAELRVLDAEGSTRWVDITLTDRLAEPSIAGVVLNVRDITERKRADESMAQLSAIVESSSDSIVGISLDGRVTSWNRSSERLYGCSAADVVGREAQLIVEAGQRARLTELLDEVRRGEHVYVPLMQAVRADGSSFELSLSISPVFDSAGALVGCSSIGRDITERRQLERERQLAEERFRLGFEKGAIGMVMYGLDGEVLRVNAALCAMLGRSEEELVGAPAESFIHPGDVDERRVMATALTSGERDNYRAERRLVRADGETIWTLVDAAVVRDESDAAAYVFAQLQDITDRKRGEDALQRQALHDALTGLPNRLALEQRLGQALERAGRSGTEVAVLFIDVDRFKLVNDGLGHVVGDKLLVELAGRLARGVRAGDTLARFGGDEFIVVCENVADVAEADALGSRILEMLDDPLAVDGMELHLSVSCGIAVVDGSTHAEEALRDADAAMYRAKEKGRDCTQVFDEGLRRAVTDRLDIEQALRAALDRGELRVEYQPIVTIPDGDLVGVEALVRWEHPVRGLLGPDEFVPAAEESGLIVAVGEHVLAEALEQVVRWRGALPGCRELWVAVNLSSRQLSLGDPVALCTRMLEESGAPPRALHLELTESAVMADVDLSIGRLEGLRALGVTIAIDDFGTGYSSLSYLSRLPVGLLKIDRSFVSRLGHGAGDSEIARAIVLLAEGLQVEVCAEGVETVGQLAELASLRCHLGQGYYWARPLAVERFEDWARARLVVAGPGDADPLALSTTA